jgi:hypothetical protein
MKRWFAVNKTLAFAFGPGAYGHVLAKDSNARSRPISRKTHSTCPLRKYTVLTTHNNCHRTVVVFHIVWSTASVRTPTLGGRRRNVVCRLLGDRICSLAPNSAWRPKHRRTTSPNTFDEKKAFTRKNLLMRFSFHGGFTASHHASIVVILQNVS